MACPRLTEFRSTSVKPYYSEVEKLPEELQVPKKYDLSISTVLDEEEGDSYVLFTKDFEVLITDKERRDHELLAKLRAEGIIKSPGALFQEIFGSKFVNEIKGKGTPTLYEKSRMTDDVLMVVNLAMRAREERELVKSKLKSKEIETLIHAEPMIFNRCKLSLDKERFGLSVGQKGQAIFSNEAYKCKRVIRAVLAFELYAMSLSIDIAIAMSTTFA
ncbi:hypothetical protein MBM_00066 [Drepanopeziza brunnea f. sp. 'multigermtubi' MB_m1]|uniref:Polyprotein n=1 Tax=Marssonina brunnea f. sp. multigermtubi (strain MB_m1) TaxID=1072389 RepID=K1XJT2_MARBU|nr:uncharacterized protein MBM_00066 [Drepanopeziza brunnea f. sp. 'multigermtubi' MB_m1]EKD20953.1 hypothetical protein MBM_00066 [Drepanopeziza brunnea f. sp. 'multigermtubi' MB_m1]